jgi:hypothetical protein
VGCKLLALKSFRHSCSEPGCEGVEHQDYPGAVGRSQDSLHDTPPPLLEIAPLRGKLPAFDGLQALAATSTQRVLANSFGEQRWDVLSAA